MWIKTEMYGGGVGHCIYSRLVYMTRGVGDIEGEGCTQAGGFWGDSVVYHAPLRQKWVEVGDCGGGKWVTDIKNTCI